MKVEIIILFLFIQNSVRAKDAFTIQFIKSFIQNEGKPTHLIYGGLCWKKNVINKLVIEVSKVGVRTSASFKPLSKYQDHAIMYLTDLDCEQSNEVISYASEKELFQFTYRWLVLVSSPELKEEKLPLLEDGPVLVDSDLVLAERVGDQFQMVEMHRPGINGTMITSPRGFYNGSLVDTRPNRELYKRRRNMMGHPIIMSNVIQDSNTTRYHLPREDRL
ncbi:unnamed protein product [Chrysodeixis includens]|uniref:Uncharacterized protein n=1 Tax=Chrysodeixis includens TaxID=689277 RepID=A0A9N8L639_CHRIL|nr:unnamed protein product [Chrysodeixis includens]